MTRLRAVIVASLALAGCTQMIDRGERNALSEIKGKTSEQTISRLGIPTDEKTIAGKRVLIWKDIEAGGIYCQMAVLFGDDDHAIRGELSGMNGPCMNWLQSRGFM